MIEEVDDDMFKDDRQNLIRKMDEKADCLKQVCDSVEDMDIQPSCKKRALS